MAVHDVSVQISSAWMTKLQKMKIGKVQQMLSIKEKQMDIGRMMDDCDELHETIEALAEEQDMYETQQSFLIKRIKVVNRKLNIMFKKVKREHEYFVYGKKNNSLCH